MSTEVIAPVPQQLEMMFTDSIEPPAKTAPRSGAAVRKGRRNNHLIQQAGRLRARGAGYDEILPELLAANSNFEPPLDEEEVEGVARSIMRYPAGLDLTEDGVAAAVAEVAGGEVKYSPSRGGFLYYHDGRWSADKQGLRAQELVKDWLNTTKAGIVQDPRLDDDDRKALLKRIDSFRKSTPIRGVVQLLKSQPTVLDVKPWDEPGLVVNFRNGTLKLPSLELQPHRPEDRLLKRLDYDYDPEATCPVFEQVLAQALDDDKAAFLRRLFGYALGGTGGLQRMAILKGVGRNGKSVIVGAVDHAMGSYSVTTEPTTFLNGHQSSINNAVAALHGARLVTTSELNTGQGLDASLVKRITGGDMISARFLYSEHFQFEFKGLIVMITNFAPLFDGSDSAIARRLLIVDFPHVVDAKDVDTTLPEKLKQEAPGIMNWLLRGCLDYLQGGIQIPASVEAETDAAVRDHNQVLQFVEDVCELGPDLKTGARSLYQDYRSWSCRGNLKPMSERSFKNAMERTFGLIHGRTKGGNVWYGIVAKSFSAWI